MKSSSEDWSVCWECSREGMEGGLCLRVKLLAGYLQFLSENSTLCIPSKIEELATEKLCLRVKLLTGDLYFLSENSTLCIPSKIEMSSALII